MPRHDTPPRTVAPPVRPDPARPAPVITDLPGTALTGEMLAQLRELTRDEPALEPAARVALALHPAPLVRWTVLGRFGADLGTSTLATLPDWPDGTDYRAWILRQALEEADAAGAVWTPVLDRLDASRFWQHYYATAAAAVSPVRRDWAATHRAAALVPWITAQADPAALAPLWTFESRTVRSLVARHARCLTPAVLTAEVLPSPTVACAAAENPDLAPEVADLLARHLAEACITRSERYHRDRLHTALAYLGTRPGGLPPGAHALARARLTDGPTGRLPAADVVARDWGADAALIREAADRGYDCRSVQAAVLAHPAAEARVRERILSAGTEVSQQSVSACLDLPAVHPTGLIAIVKHRRGNRTVVQRVLAHPSATAEVDRAVLAYCTDADIRQLVADSPRAVRDPAVRATLARTRTPAIALALLHRAWRTLEPAAWRKCAALATAEAPDAFAALLDAHGLPPHVPLTAVDLQPLLRTCAEAGRRTVIALVHRLSGPRASVPAPHPPRGPSRRA